jgi:hypothetical protein
MPWLLPEYGVAMRMRAEPLLAALPVRLKGSCTLYWPSSSISAYWPEPSASTMALTVPANERPDHGPRRAELHGGRNGLEFQVVVGLAGLAAKGIFDARQQHAGLGAAVLALR